MYDDLKPGTGITFHRGAISYEGTITSRTVSNGIVIYEVDVNAPGGGPTIDSIGIHDQQIDRAYD